MSKAFTKEDVDLPERVGRARSSGGLPPGAVNYITARGARRLEEELAELRRLAENTVRIAELERILASTVMVESPDPPFTSVAFGASVTVENGRGKIERYRIVGVDELGLYNDAVSWISPDGRTLLAAELGQRVNLESSAGPVKILRIEYPD